MEKSRTTLKKYLIPQSKITYQVLCSTEQFIEKTTSLIEFDTSKLKRHWLTDNYSSKKIFQGTVHKNYFQIYKLSRNIKGYFICVKGELFNQNDNTILKVTYRLNSASIVLNILILTVSSLATIILLFVSLFNFQPLYLIAPLIPLFMIFSIKIYFNNEVENLEKLLSRRLNLKKL